MTAPGDPFNPKNGEFAENIRDVTDSSSDAELRASLQRFGWVARFPALLDERGVCLVGHRRLKIAGELNIPPVVERLDLGIGDAADAERFKLAIVSNIGFKPMTKQDRQRIAEYLYGDREWTMERIAQALNVSHKTVSKDLSDFVPPVQNVPKGKGRPKNTRLKTKPVKFDREVRTRVASLVLDEGKTFRDAEREAGVSNIVARTEVAREQGRREAREEPLVDRASLSPSQQKKLDAALRRFQADLELENRRRFGEEIDKHLQDTIMPHYKMMEKKYRDLVESRTKGIMTRKVYLLILSCLHTDSRKSVSDERLNAAFHAFSAMQTKLLSEEDDPTPKFKMPTTLAELMALKRKAADERRAKRAKRGEPTSVVRR